MNTTTITIQWNDYDGYRDALRAVRMHPQNTFEQNDKSFSVKAESKIVRYTPERQRQVMEYFGCMVDKPNRNRLANDRLCWIRYLIWRYCYSKFDITQTEIARVSNNNRSSIANGLAKIQELLEFNDIRQLRDEVYAKCDEVFR